MTKEYISRDEMIERTKARVVLGAPRFNTGLEAAIEVATSIPAADVVEVVKCAECQYNGHCFTQGFVRDEGLTPFDENKWYCADGKRKDGGKDDAEIH